MTSHNIRKSKEFKVGGWARTRAWGTRVYRVLAVTKRNVDVLGEFWNTEAQKYERRWVPTEGTRLKLQKVFETNKGKPKFTNSKPFYVRGLSPSAIYQVRDKHGAFVSINAGTLSWYYPAEAQ
jgi:hypothetical protein